jgi:hypothetical protein
MLILDESGGREIYSRKSQTSTYPVGLRFAVRCMGGRHTVHRLAFDSVGQQVADEVILSLTREQDAEHAARKLANV